MFPPMGLFWGLSYQRTDLTEATISLRHYGKAVARIADRLDIRRMRIAWDECQAHRERDAIYSYLTAVFDLVAWWAAEGRAISRHENTRPP